MAAVPIKKIVRKFAWYSKSYDNMYGRGPLPGGCKYQTPCGKTVTVTHTSFTENQIPHGPDDLVYVGEVTGQPVQFGWFSKGKHDSMGSVSYRKLDGEIVNVTHTSSTEFYVYAPSSDIVLLGEIISIPVKYGWLIDNGDTMARYTTPDGEIVEVNAVTYSLAYPGPGYRFVSEVSEQVSNDEQTNDELRIHKYHSHAHPVIKYDSDSLSRVKNLIDRDNEIRLKQLKLLVFLIFIFEFFLFFIPLYIPL